MGLTYPSRVLHNRGMATRATTGQGQIVNAKDFIEAQADYLRSQGRHVEVTERDDDYGKLVSVWSAGQSYGDASIALYAFKSSRTGRWRFRGASIYKNLGKV